MKLTTETVLGRELIRAPDVAQERLDHFVDDQKNNLNHFIDEGSLYYRTWAEGELKECGRDSDSAGLKEVISEPSAFATPILKPRLTTQIPGGAVRSPNPTSRPSCNKEETQEDPTMPMVAEHPTLKREKGKSKALAEPSRKAERLTEDAIEYRERAWLSNLGCRFAWP